MYYFALIFTNFFVLFKNFLQIFSFSHVFISSFIPFILPIISIIFPINKNVFDVKEIIFNFFIFSKNFDLTFLHFQMNFPERNSNNTNSLYLNNIWKYKWMNKLLTFSQESVKFITSIHSIEFDQFNLSSNWIFIHQNSFINWHYF